MYKISTMDNAISVESGGKGDELLAEALAIVTALHSILSKRNKHAGNIFMMMCLDGIPFSEAVKGDVEYVGEVEEQEQERKPSQEERSAIIDRLVDSIFSAHRDDDMEGDMDES